MSAYGTAAVPQQDSVITAEAARELTDTIRARAGQLWELIEQAYLTRAWVALDYDSWDAYCAAEFDGARLRIPREERSEIVASLREIGMSTRAIAAATGLGQGTVHREIEGLRTAVPNGTPDSVVGLDGKGYLPEPVEREPFPIDQDDDRDAGRGPAPRRRRPITESFDTARSELVTKTNTLVRLIDDDRFDRYAAQISHGNLGDLQRARDALEQVIDRLSESFDHPEEG
ncbi:hypothetical protein H0264_18525 [Nocardia huaxiensis]|uniref:Uncharacterized protein n=1 Tax=Nocardia huaxiensis TaxID=2755382 RepID=A0A7D6VNI1_9NOCA|nr:hypothetical protein [Nocardia huaxiensis]QLY33956.1 hypothetical protein H0264_18525 [Nocardia huaxiensis]